MASSSNDPVQLAAKLASGNADGRALRWVANGLAAFLKAGGTLPLERCLRLPSTQQGLRLAQRNVWLQQAAQEVRGESAWGCASALAHEYEVFISRGAWRFWRDLSEPPAGISRLHCALWHVAAARDGQGLSIKQIHRIVRHTYDAQCPPRC